MNQEKSEDMGQETDLQGISVLLADDEEINTEIATAILEGHGMRVTVASNGDEAVARYKDGVFDLVLMDVVMPVKNGYQATIEIREFESQEGRKHTPIMALTAFCGPEERENCFKNGMDGYMPKPIDWFALINEVTLVLTGKKRINKKPGRFKGIDYDKFLYEMCNKNEELAVRLIGKFISARGPELIEAADEAVSLRDIQKLRAVCHSIIGVSNSMCAFSMAEEASELRRLAINGELDELPKIIGRLKETHQQMLTWWESFPKANTE